MVVASLSSQSDIMPVIDGESFAFLKQMSALVPGVIYVFNHQTMSNEYANRSIAELLGYTPDEIRAMGEELLPTVIHSDDFDRLADHMASLQDLEPGEQAVWEFRAIKRDLTEVWLRSVESVFSRAPDGAVLRTIGVALDITAQKTAEIELRRLNANLEARVADRTRALEELNNALELRVEERTRALISATTELENLSYVAAHDLKVPIDNISSLLHMMDEARGILPPEHTETLTWMHSACDQAARKLDALICVAQANATQDGPFVHVGLREALDKVLTSLHFQLEQARAWVTVDLDQPTAYFLPPDIENILKAVISNAVSYREPSRRLSVKVKSAMVDNAVVVTVSDNGTGIDLEQDMAKVFGLFKRAHVEPDGAGVSLYTIRRTMMRIGGSIDVTSKPGEGSNFILSFPQPSQKKEEA